MHYNLYQSIVSSLVYPLYMCLYHCFLLTIDFPCNLLYYKLYFIRVCISEHRSMSQTVFRQTWKQLLPFIVTARPMTDLCWTCQKNNVLIYRSANKSDRLILQELHLETVKQERAEYNKMVGYAKDVCRQLGIGELSANTPCSRQIEMHYSFNYAQQVHLPSDPLQPGPIYFLVPRKVGLFGVCCEGLPKQVNFLIDEAHLISKGSNAVNSFLHYVF